MLRLRHRFVGEHFAVTSHADFLASKHAYLVKSSLLGAFEFWSAFCLHMRNIMKNINSFERVTIMIRFLFVALVLVSFSPHALHAKPEIYRKVAFSASYQSVKARSAEAKGQVTDLVLEELEGYFKIENEEERKEEIRSLVVFRHRQDFAKLTKPQLLRLLPLGNDDWRMTLLMLNFNWLKDHAEMAEHFPKGTVVN